MRIELQSKLPRYPLAFQRQSVLCSQLPIQSVLNGHLPDTVIVMQPQISGPHGDHFKQI
jgi:hypothetical protein